MIVTVCELSENEAEFHSDWKGLINHISVNQSELVLLPELPFSKWIAVKRTPDIGQVNLCINRHREWLARIDELGAPIVVYTKPVLEGNKLFNTSYIWTKDAGHKKIHTKYFFPEEEYFWEASWFNREDKHFEIVTINGIRIGVLICTEIWFTEQARKYGREGVDILLCPRASPADSTEQWIRCGQTLAVISGAFCLSSNKTGQNDQGFNWGGNGWIAEPGNGNLLSVTSSTEKFISQDIDLTKTRNAKNEYPLYVKE